MPDRKRRELLVLRGALAGAAAALRQLRGGRVIE
jgi:hypothetical protein